MNIIKIKEIVKKRIESQDAEMKEHFDKRTHHHIGLVNKYLIKIASLCLPEIDNDLLLSDSHDASKFEDPEYTPYLHINWKYKLKDEGKTYNPPKEVDRAMRIASFHHVTHNPHHPEYWDKSWTLEKDSDKKDRDAPSKDKVDATKMPPTYIAQMIADWTGMDEEKSKNKTGPYSAKNWADKNVNIRWKFTPQQVELIYRIIGLI